MNNPNLKPLDIRKKKFFYYTVLYILLALITWICARLNFFHSVSLVDPENAQINYTDVIGTLGGLPGDSASIGQTFISRRSKLDSLTLWLSDAQPASTDPPSGQSPSAFSIALSLNPETKPFYRANYRLPQAGFKGAFKISFPPSVDLPEQTYFAQFIPLEGRIQIQGRLEDNYPDGQAFLSNEMIPGDLAFSTTYRYSIPAVLEDARTILSGFWLVIPLGLTLILPGWLLLDVFKLLPRMSFIYRLTASTGISLAILPLAMFWSSQLGIKWNAPGVKIVMVVIAILAAWQFYKHREPIKIPKFRIENLFLFLIIGAVTFTRLTMVRDLAFPPWVDGVHHALITRLIQIQGGFPTTYEPYFSIDTTAYHIGFHSGAAVFQWLSGLPLQKALLIYGQALNVLGVLATGLFTLSLTRNRAAAAGAVLAAGMLTPLPAYLTSWSRYPHLAGLIVLAAILALSGEIRWSRFHPPVKKWMNILLAGMVLAGLILIHARVAVFLLCWWFAGFLSALKGTQLKKKMLVPLATGLTGLLLTLPLILSTFRKTIITQLETSPAAIGGLLRDFDPSLLESIFGGVILSFAGLGLILLFLSHTRLAITGTLWTILLFFSASLKALGLPGGSFFNYVTVEITLFLWIDLLAGYGTARVLRRLADRIPPGSRFILYQAVFVGALIVTLAGSTRILPILNPSTVLGHAADLPALTWIGENLPPNEILLINPFNWGYGLCAGSDGGYWIAPIAGLPTMPPPVLYGFGESGTIQQVEDECQQTISNAKDPHALWEQMKHAGIRYLYVGSRGGPLSAQAIVNNSSFKTLYQNGNTWIFQVLP